MPSFGDAKTMESHADTAKKLGVERKARAFVVQRAHPKVDQNIGYVLVPKKKVPRSAACFATKEPWSRVST